MEHVGYVECSWQPGITCGDAMANPALGMPQHHKENERLWALHNVQVIDHVTQSQYALELLLPQGDYAGALDIMSDIQVSTHFLTSCI